MLKSGRGSSETTSPLKYVIAALTVGIGGSFALDAGFVAAETVRKLSGAEIRAKFAGMQLSDKLHYRLVYERDGALRSIAMGVEKRGKWIISKNQLCLHLRGPDDDCYDVALSGTTFSLTPAGPGSPMDGVLQPISNPN